MNVSWLNDFLALAAHGNFSRAAEMRHLTQPAFSRRIRALEEWLGVVLFDRSSHPITLTETGEWFRTTAQEILTRMARVPEEARAVSDRSLSSLRFASTHALSFTFVPNWLRGLESRVAVGPIQLASDVLQQCEALMLQGRVQFVLCHWNQRVPGRLDTAAHPSLRIGSDTLLPVSAPNTAGQPKHSLPSSGGGKVSLLAYSAESGIGRIVRTMCGPALEKVNAEPIFTAHLASVLKTMALEGRGVAWLPKSLITEELSSGRLVAAGGSQWKVDVEIRLFRDKSSMPSVAEAFWSALSATAD